MLTGCWCLNGPIMWNCANSSPSPSPFFIKTPSFQASWSNPLSPAWDKFRPRAPPLNCLVYLHQDSLFVIFGCTLNWEQNGGFPTRFFQFIHLVLRPVCSWHFSLSWTQRINWVSLSYSSCGETATRQELPHSSTDIILSKERTQLQVRTAWFCWDRVG